MIDLHTHSTASDGSDSPERLVQLAASLHLQALAITDHDTLAGSDLALPAAAALGLTFVRGIELSTRLLSEPDPTRRSVHILGYFFAEPGPGFRAWVDSLRSRRQARNSALAENLCRHGMNVALEEAEAHARNITGRPHFARVLRDKGYAASMEEAFRLYLGETGACYVEREDPPPEEAIGRITEAGGVASLAHPRRLRQTDPLAEESLIRALAAAGLGAIEVWHSDHGESHRSRYSHLARKYNLALTGGSDYHGDDKPGILLGRGRNGHRVPLSALDELRRRAGH
ncbi:MAG: PHP domain-containing protein [Candidatus Solibacter usitatus]|nr:PHP domain-containing protein [Candidatus Solibacter usitatus]